ncbi:MAG: TonB-dependent receptor plug domain-containing protein, partial [Sphingobium sp.]
MKHSLLAGVALLCLGAPMAAQADDLAGASDGDTADIVVTGQRAQQERSIDAKRAAIGVLDVAAADEIGQLPDRNVAEVIEHLPGVGVTYDQGEGRYVAIRGVPSNLNGYTLNGMELGNPDGNTRSLPLDIVSGQLLNRIEIAKVKTADMDGQGIGGTVNLVTQTAFDFKDRFNIGINAQAGYQELNKKVPVRGDLSLATRFGSDDQFGIVLGGSYSRRDFNSEGFYPDDWRPVAGLARGGAPTNIKFTEYSLVRERIGATGSFDWHPSDRQTFYVRGLYSKFTEDEVRPRYRLDFATDAIVNSAANWTVNPDGLTGTANGTERRVDLRLDYKAKEILTSELGGSTDFGALKLDYSGGYTRNKVLDSYKIWQFRCNPGIVDFNFTNPIYTATPRTECTANQLAFRQYQDYLQEGREEIWQGKVDATYDLGGDRGFLKVGAKYRSSDRRLDQRNDTYAPASATYRFSLGANNLQGADAIVYPDSSDTSRGYLNAPTIDPAKMLAFTAANFSNTNYFKLDAATSLSNAVLNDFNLTEDVAAAYAMGNLKFGVVT